VELNQSISLFGFRHLEVVLRFWGRFLLPQEIYDIQELGAEALNSHVVPLSNARLDL
jgi:hypothetical protein